VTTLLIYLINSSYFFSGVEESNRLLLETDGVVWDLQLILWATIRLIVPVRSY
jgi:hypothetical protein